MSPAPAPLHQIVADELRTLLSPLVKPHEARAVTTLAVRVTDEDGPVPDIIVVDVAEPRDLTGAVPVAAVHTAVEVVSPSTALLDRAPESEMYADAGIPCYWRIELEHSRRHEGPFPLAVGPETWIDVTLDPASLDTL